MAGSGQNPPDREVLAGERLDGAEVRVGPVPDEVQGGVVLEHLGVSGAGEEDGFFDALANGPVAATDPRVIGGDLVDAQGPRP